MWPLNTMIKQDTIESYINKRDKALIELNFDFIKEICPGAKDEQLEIILHKARYECTRIPDKYRLASRDWLIDNNYSRFHGLDFLPGDELPI